MLLLCSTDRVASSDNEAQHAMCDMGRSSAAVLLHLPCASRARPPRCRATAASVAGMNARSNGSSVCACACIRFAGVCVEEHVGAGMVHVYPLFAALVRHLM